MEKTAGTLSMSLPSPSSSLLGHIVTIDSIGARDFGIKSISLPRRQLKSDNFLKQRVFRHQESSQKVIGLLKRSSNSI